MAASIRSWVKDRLTRYEAKNKIDLPLSPGAEVQVEKWLTYESPYWARVCDREHSVVIRVSDDAARRFFDQYETACTTLLRGVVSITQFQPTVARLKPGRAPQLVLDVRAFNTKAMGGDVLFYPDASELADEPWARDWAGRIAQAHPEQTKTVVLGSKPAAAVVPVDALLAKPPRAPVRRVRDATKVDLLELGWCLVSKDQRETLDRDYPNPPVPTKYAHLLPASRPAPPQSASATSPAHSSPKAHVDPLHLVDEDEDASDDELLIKPPPTRLDPRLPPPQADSRKRPAPATTATDNDRRRQRTSSSPVPDGGAADIGSSQSHTVTHSSPSHFSASQQDGDQQEHPPPAKRARVSLGAAVLGSKVLVPASDSDVHSQESRVGGSQAHSGGSGQPTTSSNGSGGSAAEGRGPATSATDSSSSAADGAVPSAFRPFTASTVDEPPFTLAQHNISLQVVSPSTTTASGADRSGDHHHHHGLPSFSLDEHSGSNSGGSIPSSSAQNPLPLAPPPTTTTQTTGSSTQPLGDGDVVMQESTPSTAISTELLEAVVVDGAGVPSSLAAAEPVSQQQHALVDESHTDDEMLVDEEMALEVEQDAAAERGVQAETAPAVEEQAAVEVEANAPPVEEAGSGPQPTGTEGPPPAAVSAGDEAVAQAEPVVAPTTAAEPAQGEGRRSPSPTGPAPDSADTSSQVGPDQSPASGRLVGTSSGDAELVDALTPSLLAPADEDDAEVVKDSQPPSRTDSQMDLEGDGQRVDVAGGQEGSSQQQQQQQQVDASQAVEVEGEASLPVSRLPRPTVPAPAHTPTTDAPPPPPGPPPPLPTSAPPAPAPPATAPQPAAPPPPAQPLVRPKLEVVDLRSPSPEISIIEPPPPPPASTTTTTAAAAAPASRPTANPHAAPYHSRAGLAAPPPPPPPPPNRPLIKPYAPPKPSFTLSRTLDLPRDHGLPLYDDVLEILRRAQQWQGRQAR